MFSAKSIMKTDLITVREDTPIYTAMRILLEHRVTGLPVVEEGMRLIGVVSEKDMLATLYNAKMGRDTVASIMTRDVVVFQEDDDLIDVCEAMIKGSFRRVPIVSGGKLVGLISRRDIIKFILELRRV